MNKIKSAVLVLALSISQIILSEDSIKYQTHPGSSSRDYSKPTWVTNGNTTYQTHPGSSSRDYSKPLIKTK